MDYYHCHQSQSHQSQLQSCRSLHRVWVLLVLMRQKYNPWKLGKTMRLNQGVCIKLNSQGRLKLGWKHGDLYIARSNGAEANDFLFRLPYLNN